MAAITDSKQYENSQFTLKIGGGGLFIFFIPERGGLNNTMEGTK